jgi:hypothetical protein
MGGRRRKLHNEYLYNLYLPQNILKNEVENNEKGAVVSQIGR